MNIEVIAEQINKYKIANKKLFATSSFQTHSIVMLHLLSRIDKSIPVYFLNTGFLFPETITYKDNIAKEFGLNIINLSSFIPKHLQKNSSGEMLFTNDPDYCCFINKVQPVEPLLKLMDVWINGVRADQSSHRKNLNIEEKTKFNAIRYHPMLDWTSKMIFDYLKEYNIPRHPLEEKGYLSIGCEPCTRKVTGNDIRDSRWFGMNKTECGLNTELINKK